MGAIASRLPVCISVHLIARTSLEPIGRKRTSGNIRLGIAVPDRSGARPAAESAVSLNERTPRIIDLHSPQMRGVQAGSAGRRLNSVRLGNGAPTPPRNMLGSGLDLARMTLHREVGTLLGHNGSKMFVFRRAVLIVYNSLKPSIADTGRRPLLGQV